MIESCWFRENVSMVKQGNIQKIRIEVKWSRQKVEKEQIVGRSRQNMFFFYRQLWYIIRKFYKSVQQLQVLNYVYSINRNIERMKSIGVLALTIATVFGQGYNNNINGYRNYIKGSDNLAVGSNIIAEGSGNRLVGNLVGFRGNGVQMFGVNAQPQFVNGDRVNLSSLPNYQGNLQPGSSNGDVYREAVSSMRNWAPPSQLPRLSDYQRTAAGNWDW